MISKWFAISISVFLAAVPNLLAEDPAWVLNLRAGKVGGAGFEAEAGRKWLHAQLKPGESTKAEVFKLLGDPAKQKIKNPGFRHDLDRPERDKIESLQYVIVFHDMANWTAINVSFDSKTEILTHFGISGSICGYCPHVLAHDGESWRLEGKMLAGCVGADRTGRDLLLLPRLIADDGVARVRLANWAPEIEQLHDPKLLAVSLRAEEELDVDLNGNPVAWTPLREVALPNLALADGDVLVLELTNTSELENYLRGVFLDGRPEDRSTDLTVDFGTAGAVDIKAVGTKFLRRVVVPIPAGATSVTLGGEQSFWFSRRAWIGSRASIEGRSAWISPMQSPAEYRLNPMESADLNFPIEMSGRLGFALRLSGFYTFESQ